MKSFGHISGSIADWSNRWRVETVTMGSWSKKSVKKNEFRLKWQETFKMRFSQSSLNVFCIFFSLLKNIYN